MILPQIKTLYNINRRGKFAKIGAAILHPLLINRLVIDEFLPNLDEVRIFNLIPFLEG